VRGDLRQLSTALRSSKDTKGEIVIAFQFNILNQHAPKSKFATECNHCGLCCRVQACEVSLNFLHSNQTPCIALEVHDGKFLCGVVLRPEHYFPQANQDGKPMEEVREIVKQILAIGEGCGMPDNVALARIEDHPELDRAHAVIDVRCPSCFKAVTLTSIDMQCPSCDTRLVEHIEVGP